MSSSISIFGVTASNTQRRFIMHAMFWIAWLSRTLYDILRIFGTQSALLFSLTYIFTQMPFVYLHLYYLVPNFLNKKKFKSYILLTLITLFTYSYFNYIVLQHLPSVWIPLKMSYYINSLEPLYDVFEGLFAFVITYALKYTWLAISTENKILELQKDNLQLELNVLKAQVNPHFLFNSLNNIYALSLQKSEQTPEVIIKLSNLMRYVLYECNASKVSIVKEIQFIYDFIELEKVRHINTEKIKFNLTGMPDKSEIEPFLLIPFVENAFKHGLNNVPEKNWVIIDLAFENKVIKLTIENSLSEKIDSKILPSGIGLQNVRKRLKLLYPKNHQLKITVTDVSYKTELRIDIV
jgi:LytS/YehU family sensor histidine kinase